MMGDINNKISRVLDTDFEVPSIFKQILRKETSLLPDEEIEDLVFLDREYLRERIESPVYSAAKLLVLTSYGLIIVEEGFIEISDNIMGYKIQHIPFSKITSIELDACLLAGTLKISTSSYGKMEVEIPFNTARYYEDFESFISALRIKIVLA
ncbi:hypothetical protein [Vibrio salinus]|uniref:hypothetical protein n=1 Tax=Vibrio salinus TaxID=2899784 RepID=UPI001E4939F7|nr:hypothetical protein [Vibrio salinus]MCE0495723.1 hypothetical protein [Vibrio salinus]